MTEPPTIPDEEPGPVVTGWNDSPVTGDRIDVNENSFIAGDPAGARIEIRSTGFHAFNGTGIETAHIDGAEGVFVGGEFRTSDTLPGQVALSDTANQGTPGISIEPADDTGYDVLPSIGPGPDDMHISGGVSTAGAMSGAQFSASGTNIYHNAPGETGAGSWVLVDETEARLAYRPDRTNINYESGVWVRPGNARIFSEDESGVGTVSATGAGALVEHVPVAGQGDRVSRVSATATKAMLSMSAEDGLTRRLRVDDSGVWADIETGPYTHNYTSYNLLETAQDSGWQSVAVESGITPGTAFAWRNKGGIIWWRGTVTATWTEGWNTIAADLPAAIRPEYAHTVNEAGTAAGVLIRVQVDGVLHLYSPTAGTSTHRFTSLSYPVG